MQTTNWYQIDDIDQIDSPALVVFPERVKHNIDKAIEIAGGVSRLRPHVKTHKSPEVCRLMLDAGIYKFKCATIAEAEMLAIEKAPDVLLAYQPVKPKVLRLLELVKAYPATKFSCLTDHIESARMIGELAQEQNVEIPVYIDVNTGMNRTGIAPSDKLMEFYIQLTEISGIIVAGFHAYDGHIRNTDLSDRTRLCKEALQPVLEIREKLVAQGYTQTTIIAGGSPSFPVHARNKEVECSPGTFVYWDKGYQSLFPEQQFLTAALVITRVVSLPSPSKICVDLGHKSIAVENELSKRVFFLIGGDLIPVGQSEEHLVLEAGEGHSYKVGDVLYGLPYHICPTCALYEKAFTIEKNKLTGTWKTLARDRTITY
jgi:D-serine deaminase-like pyridoxal phosphate-dependent protein